MRSKNLLIALLMPLMCSAQVLTLDECRQLAQQKNKNMQANTEIVEASKMMKKAAMSHFFPRVSANGAYMWNQDNIHLAPSEYPVSLGGLELFRLKANGSGLLDPLYTRVYDDLSIDIQHVLVGQVGATQPIFVGGKIVNMYKLAKIGEDVATLKATADSKDLIVKVDEAYWRVVSVEEKVKLAHQYRDLLVKLNSDVDALVAEGVATKSDKLKATLKLNEAEEKVGQAEDGLILSRMALCELLGLPLDYEIHVDSTGIEDIDLTLHSDNLIGVAERRNEIQILEKAEQAAKATKNIAAAGLMPNIVASANYLMTNKNLNNGIDPMKFWGFFNVGVVVNVPIAHPDAICRLKAAQHTEKAAHLKVEEAREMIMLQATQSQQKVAAAERKLTRTKTACRNAEEVLRMAQAGFDEGVISSTELLGAHTQWMSANTDRIDAAIELRLAELTYRKHTGKL